MTSIDKTSNYPKYDVSEMVFILHYRKDSEDRERNLREVLKFLNKNFNAKIFVNHDKKQDDDLASWVDTEYGACYFLTLNDDEFKKAKCFNDIANRRDERILCFWDVDVIIDPANIKKAYDSILEGKVEHVYPFNGTFIDVNYDKFDELLDQEFGNLYNSYLEGDKDLEFASGESPGGCNMITREAFKRICGYDEQFIGWGFEDTDFYHRSLKVNKLGRLTNPKAICWHMHHDQAIRLENPHYENNLKVFNENCRRGYSFYQKYGQTYEDYCRCYG